MRLLRSAMAEPGLTVETAIVLVDYHARAEQDRQGLTRQDLACQARGRQIPAAVELV